MGGFESKHVGWVRSLAVRCSAERIARLMGILAAVCDVCRAAESAEIAQSIALDKSYANVQDCGQRVSSRHRRQR
jgi:hypothetical protein